MEWIDTVGNTTRVYDIHSLWYLTLRMEHIGKPMHWYSIPHDCIDVPISLFIQSSLPLPTIVRVIRGDIDSLPEALCNRPGLLHLLWIQIIVLAQSRCPSI
jgi:hypothetical protein